MRLMGIGIVLSLLNICGVASEQKGKGNATLFQGVHVALGGSFS